MKKPMTATEVLMRQAIYKPKLDDAIGYFEYILEPLVRYIYEYIKWKLPGVQPGDLEW